MEVKGIQQKSMIMAWHHIISVSTGTLLVCLKAKKTCKCRNVAKEQQHLLIDCLYVAGIENDKLGQSECPCTTDAMAHDPQSGPRGDLISN